MRGQPFGDLAAAAGLAAVVLDTDKAAPGLVVLDADLGAGWSVGHELAVFRIGAEFDDFDLVRHIAALAEAAPLGEAPGLVPRLVKVIRFLQEGSHEESRSCSYRVARRMRVRAGRRGQRTGGEFALESLLCTTASEHRAAPFPSLHQ